MTLLDEILEGILYGDPEIVDAVIEQASSSQKAVATQQAERRINNLDFQDQVEKGALEQAISDLNPMTFAAMDVSKLVSDGKPTVLTYVLLTGGLATAWYFFVKKK